MSSAPIVPGPPQAEAPIFIGNVHHGDDHYYNLSDTTAGEARPLGPRDVWVQLDSVPYIPPGPPAPFPGTTVGVVSAIADVPLNQVPGDAYRFSYQGGLPQQFANMIPANYGGGAYAPTLKDLNGVVIPYDPSVWVADGVRSVVEFKRATPEQLGYSPPLYLSYWQYIGTFAGSGGSGPGPTPTPPPLAVNLYVDDTGSDATGDGTLTSPYATLPYAFGKLSETGWDFSAKVTIINTVTILATTTTSLALNPGTLGQQFTPPIIQGLSRPVIATGTVSSATRNPGSNLMNVITTAPIFGTSKVGDIVRFTTGPLSNYTPGGQFGPAAGGFQLEAYIVNINTSSSVRIAYADTPSPVAGNQISVVTNGSKLVVNGTGGKVTLETLSSRTLIWQNLDMSLAADLVMRSPTQLVGVRFPLRASVDITNPGAPMQWGSYPTAYVQSVLGVAAFPDSSVPLGFYTFQRLADDDTALVATNCAFQQTNSGITLEGNIRLSSSNMLGGVVDARFGTSTIANCRLQGGASAVTVRDGAGLNLRDFSLETSTSAAISATNGGAAVVSGTVSIVGAEFAFSATNGGLISNSASLPAVSGTAKTAVLHAVAGTIITSTLIPGNGSWTYYAYAEDTGTIISSANITLTGTYTNAVYLIGCARMQCEGLTTTSATATDYMIKLQEGSQLVAGTVAVRQKGCQLLTSSRAYADAFTCNNSAEGLAIEKDSTFYCGTFTATNTPLAVVAKSASAVRCTTLSATGGDVDLENASLQATTATVRRVEATAGSEVEATSLTASNRGVELSDSTLTATTLTVSGTVAGYVGLKATGSWLTAGTVTASSSVSGAELIGTNAFISTLTVSNSTTGLTLSDGSNLAVGGTLTADSCTTGVTSSQSELTADTLSAKLCTTGVTLDSSQLYCETLDTAASAVSATKSSIIYATNVTASSGDLTLAASGFHTATAAIRSMAASLSSEVGAGSLTASRGVTLDSSTLSATTLTVSNTPATFVGLKATGSWVTAGSIVASTCVAAIEIINTGARVDSLDVSSSTTGVSLADGSELSINDTLNADSCGTGVTATQSVLSVDGLSARFCTTGILLDASKLRCVTLDTATTTAALTATKSSEVQASTVTSASGNFIITSSGFQSETAAIRMMTATISSEISAGSLTASMGITLDNSTLSVTTLTISNTPVSFVGLKATGSWVTATTITATTCAAALELINSGVRADALDVSSSTVGLSLTDGSELRVANTINADSCGTAIVAAQSQLSADTLSAKLCTSGLSLDSSELHCETLDTATTLNALVATDGSSVQAVTITAAGGNFSLTASALTTTTATVRSLSAIASSEVGAGALTASRGVTLDSSTLSATTLTVSNTPATFVGLAATGSWVTAGSIIATNCIAAVQLVNTSARATTLNVSNSTAGLSITDGSELRLSGILNLDGCATGISGNQSALTAESITAKLCTTKGITLTTCDISTGSIESTGSATHNIELLSACSVQCTDITCSGGANGLIAIGACILNASASISCSSHGSRGIELQSSNLIAGDLTVTNSLGTAVQVTDDSTLLADALSCTSTATGIQSTKSTLSFEAVTMTDAATPMNITGLSNVTMSSITITNAIPSTGSGISITDASTVYISTSVSISNQSNPSSGKGISVAGNSTLVVAGPVTITNTSGIALSAVNNSSLNTNAISITSAATGIEGGDSTMTADGVTIANTANPINLTFTTDLTVAGVTITNAIPATGSGIKLSQASRMFATGTITCSDQNDATNGRGLDLAAGSSLTTSDPITISRCALEGIQLTGRADIKCGGVTLNDVPKPISATNSTWQSGAITVNKTTPASLTGEGITFTRCRALIAGALNCQNQLATGAVGLAIEESSDVVVSGTVTASGCATTGLTVETASELRCGALTAQNNLLIGVEVTDGTLLVEGAMTASNNGSIQSNIAVFTGNVAISDNSNLQVAGNLIATHLTTGPRYGAGMLIENGSSASVLGNITTDNAGISTSTTTVGYGLNISSGELRCMGSVSALNCAGASGFPAIEIFDSDFEASTCSSNSTATGIFIYGSTANITSELEANGCGNIGIRVYYSQVYAGTITAQNNLNIGVQCYNSTLQCDASMDIKNNGSTQSSLSTFTGNMDISASTVDVGADIIATHLLAGPRYGAGVLVTKGSNVLANRIDTSFAGVATSATTVSYGLRVEDSTCTCSEHITSKDCITYGMVAYNASIACSYIVLQFNRRVGLWMVASELVAFNDSLVNNNGSPQAFLNTFTGNIDMSDGSLLIARALDASHPDLVLNPRAGAGIRAFSRSVIGVSDLILDHAGVGSGNTTTVGYGIYLDNSNVECSSITASNCTGRSPDVDTDAAVVATKGSAIRCYDFTVAISGQSGLIMHDSIVRCDTLIAVSASRLIGVAMRGSKLTANGVSAINNGSIQTDLSIFTGNIIATNGSEIYVNGELDASHGVSTAYPGAGMAIQTNSCVITTDRIFCNRAGISTSSTTVGFGLLVDLNSALYCGGSLTANSCTGRGIVSYSTSAAIVADRYSTIIADSFAVDACGLNGITAVQSNISCDSMTINQVSQIALSIYQSSISIAGDINISNITNGGIYSDHSSLTARGNLNIVGLTNPNGLPEMPIIYLFNSAVSVVSYNMTATPTGVAPLDVRIGVIYAENCALSGGAVIELLSTTYGVPFLTLNATQWHSTSPILLNIGSRTENLDVLRIANNSALIISVPPSNPNSGLRIVGPKSLLTSAPGLVISALSLYESTLIINAIGSTDGSLYIGIRRNSAITAYNSLVRVISTIKTYTAAPPFVERGIELVTSTLKAGPIELGGTSDVAIGLFENSFLETPTQAIGYSLGVGLAISQGSKAFMPISPLLTGEDFEVLVGSYTRIWGQLFIGGSFIRNDANSSTSAFSSYIYRP